MTTALELFMIAEELVTRSETHMPSDLILALASESGCSSYDCEFVALAELLNAPLLTYDKQILKAFPTIAVTPGEWLKG